MDDEKEALKTKFRQQFAESLGVLRHEGWDIDSDVELLINAYTQPHRYYHDLNHIDALVTPLRKTDDEEIVSALGLDTENASQEKRFNAYKTLAALGHDCIYQGTDGGAGVCAPLLDPYIENGKLLPIEAIKNEKHQRLAKIVRRIFNVDESEIPVFYQGDKLAPNRNELLSALVTANVLDKAGLAEEDIVAVVAMIEATKPFRIQVDYVRLRGQLSKAKEEFALNLSEDDLDQIMRLAVHFGNQDVDNFKGPLADFIYKGFKILPELNPAFRGEPLDTVDYMQLLRSEFGAMDFFELGKENIYHSDGKGYPSEKTLQRYQSQVERNIQDTREYVKSKAVSLSYLHALVTKLEWPDITLEALLKNVSLPQKPGDEKDAVFKVLKGEGYQEVWTVGKDGQTRRMDTRRSALTECFWEHLGKDKMLGLYDKLEGYFDAATTIESEDRLKVGQDDEVLQLFNDEAGLGLMRKIYESIECGTESHVLSQTMRSMKSEILKGGSQPHIHKMGA